MSALADSLAHSYSRARRTDYRFTDYLASLCYMLHTPAHPPGHHTIPAQPLVVPHSLALPSLLTYSSSRGKGSRLSGRSVHITHTHAVAYCISCIHKQTHTHTQRHTRLIPITRLHSLIAIVVVVVIAI